jgi:hypothetical protein
VLEEGERVMVDRSEQVWRETTEALVRMTLVYAKREWIWDKVGLIEEVASIIGDTLLAWRARRDVGEEAE